MTMLPVMAGHEKCPEVGRDLHFTYGDLGSAGQWIKLILRHMSLWKARGRPGWWLTRISAGGPMRPPYELEYFIPVPTRTTRLFRTFFSWQLVRLIWINLKMTWMISIGNHGKPPLLLIVMPGDTEPEKLGRH